MDGVGAHESLPQQLTLDGVSQGRSALRPQAPQLMTLSSSHPMTGWPACGVQTLSGVSHMT